MVTSIPSTWARRTLSSRSESALRFGVASNPFHSVPLTDSGAGRWLSAEVTGTVQAVDPAGKSITLDNGTSLMIPATAKVDRKALTPGADVKASYQERDGHKIATSIQIAPK